MTIVRPERRVVLTGESPVRGSAEARGSRLLAGGEIRPRPKAFERQGSNPAGRNSQDAFFASGETQRMLDLPGVAGGVTLEKRNADQERPCLTAESGKDRAYKAGGRESRGGAGKPALPGKACKTPRRGEGIHKRDVLWEAARPVRRIGGERILAIE